MIKINWARLWVLGQMALVGGLWAVGPVWGHEGEPVSTTLWTAMGLGAVMAVAYGVSWGVVRPVLGRSSDEMHSGRARHENAAMRSLLDRWDEPVALIDQDGRLQLANQAWRAQVNPQAIESRPLDLADEPRWRLALDQVKAGSPRAEVNAGARDWVIEALEGCFSMRPLQAVPVLRAGPLHMDRIQGGASCGERRLDLTGTEFRLLAFLAERPNQVVGREELLRQVWGHQGQVHSRTVDTHIRRLRDKLSPHRDWIETVRGKGYCWRQQEMTG
jgi:hypothetical protein